MYLVAKINRKSSPSKKWKYYVEQVFEDRQEACDFAEKQAANDKGYEYIVLHGIVSYQWGESVLCKVLDAPKLVGGHYA